MKFGTYHTFQCPPWTTAAEVVANELARVELAETLGYDSVWVPEQHFFNYCICPDASVDILLAAWDVTRHAHHGEHYDFLEVRIWPDPVRPADEVFLYATGSSGSRATSLGEPLPSRRRVRCAR
jgi:alkanesulfonate monooxygenase SsuD/methylene tetrahydromethanopterin reductase-like flavin-dependent oxidoreductase (luciferase family)